MAPAAAQKIFISYARVDGAGLARLLKKDLAAEGYDPWLDTDRIAGGGVWTVDIESALDQADMVLALLSQGSFVSEICRAEQLRALRKGKVVIPILACQPIDIPLHLEAKNYRDFSNSSAYAERFHALLEDIQTRNGVVLKEEFRHTYVTAPPLPENFVPRPQALAALRDAVLRERFTSNLPLTALIGMGGIGKTILAQALCRDEVVQQAFPDGVIWITAGKEPTHDLTTRLREAGKALRDDLSRYDNDLGSRNQFQTTIRNKAALIVIDDVWSARDIEPFRAESPRSALLFTTRNSSIAAAVGALDHPADSLTKSESRAVLARWAAADPSRLPPEADDLISECGGVPLALAMVGAMLRGKPPILWKRQLGFLRSADLEKIKAQFPDYPYPNLFRAIQVSVDELDAATRERYLALAVLLDSMPVHPAIQQALWRTDEGEAAETAERLIDLSLAERESDGLSILLHGLQLDYVRAQYPDREALSLILGAVRLARHVISRDSAQFPSQIAGRLLAHEDQTGIKAFTARLRDQSPSPWLRLVTPSLTPPGGPLLLMIQAAEPPRSDLEPGGGLSALAISASQILSAAFNGNDLAIWDLETGEPLRTLTGHTARIVSLAVTPGGKQAISASRDKTIRLWDLATGASIWTITSEAGALTVTEDGSRFVAGSPEGALKIFATDTGNMTQELSGCDARVESIAVAGDRYVLACAGDKTYAWDLQGSAPPRVFPDLKGPMAVLPGAGRVASASGSKLTVWDLETGVTTFTTTRDSFGYDQLAALPDGRSIIYACLMDVLEVADTVTGNVRIKMPNVAARVAFLALTPDGRRAVTAVNSGEIRVWDLEARAPAHVAARHSRPVRTVAITNGGLYAASISLDGALIWDLATGTSEYQLDAAWGSNPFVDSYLSKIPGPWNRYEALLPGGLAIAAVGSKLQIRNFDTGERQPPELDAHGDNIQILRATPDGHRVVAGSEAGIVRIWSLPDGKEIATLQGHSGAIGDIVINAEARRVITASMDHSLKIWDLDTGRLQRTLEGHTGTVAGLARFPGRGLLVSASHDQTLRVWNPDTGETVTSFTAESGFMCCAAAPDNLTIVAAEIAGGVHILRLEGAPAAPSQVGPNWSAEPNRAEFGASYLQKGLECQSKKEYEQAAEFFRVAVNARVFLLGIADPAVAAALNYLAILHTEQKHYDKAEPLLTTALAIYQRTLGENDLNFATNLLNLGSVYAYQRKWALAETCFTRAVAILENDPAADQSMLAAGLGFLAQTLRQCGRVAEAEACEERAKAAQKP